MSFESDVLICARSNLRKLGGKSCPWCFLSCGLESNVSRWLGPPCMNKKITRLALAGLCRFDAEADCDERGDFGMDDVPPGYQQFRVSIEVQSSAPAESVQDIIDRSLAQSPVFAALRHPQDVVLDTRIVP